MTTHKVLGGAVRELRRAQGRTLRSVAREMCVSAGHLSAVENGTKQLGTVYQRRLADALGVDLAAITYTRAARRENTRAPGVPA